MDEKLQIQLGSAKNVNSVTVDTYDTTSLENKKGLLLEYDIRNVLNVTQIYETERQENEVYRIYGRFNWFSLLNNLNGDYKYLRDFFSGASTSDTRKTVFNSLTFYLMRPATGYTKITNKEDEYIRKFEVVAVGDNFEIYNAGFDVSIYGEQNYAYNFNVDFDVSGYLAEFNFPLTQFYLYVEYNPSTNGHGISERMTSRKWRTSDGGRFTTTFNPTPLNIGDEINADKIEYDALNYLQTQLDSAEYYIYTDYEETDDDGNPTGNHEELRWKYDPFIPLRLRFFSEEVRRANTGTTAYDQSVSIPPYATALDDEGNVVWRDIIKQGYFDPLTGNGVDYPFVNKRRYLFSDIILSMSPDTNHGNTGEVFSEILFGDPDLLNYSPTGDLDNIGKPCQ